MVERDRSVASDVLTIGVLTIGVLFIPSGSERDEKRKKTTRKEKNYKKRKESYSKIVSKY